MERIKACEAHVKEGHLEDFRKLAMDERTQVKWAYGWPSLMDMNELRRMVKWECDVLISSTAGAKRVVREFWRQGEKWRGEVRVAVRRREVMDEDAEDSEGESRDMASAVDDDGTGKLAMVLGEDDVEVQEGGEAEEEEEEVARMNDPKGGSPPRQRAVVLKFRPAVKNMGLEPLGPREPVVDRRGIREGSEVGAAEAEDRRGEGDGWCPCCRCYTPAMGRALGFEVNVVCAMCGGELVDGVVAT